MDATFLGRNIKTRKLPCKMRTSSVDCLKSRHRKELLGLCLRECCKRTARLKRMKLEKGYKEVDEETFIRKSKVVE